MATKQGKVKSIPVDEIIEGMQVMWKAFSGNTHIGKVKYYVSDNHVTIEAVTTNGMVSLCKRDIKILVVQYTEFSHFSQDLMKTAVYKEKSIPLKWKQWQSAIDNGEVDSDKTIQFEDILNYTCTCGIDPHILNTRGCYGGMDCKANAVHYAKIIPQKFSALEFDLETSVMKQSIKFVEWLATNRYEFNTFLGKVTWEKSGEPYRSTEEMYKLFLSKN